MALRKKFTFSEAELNVGAAAIRRANDQLLRVPWTKFRRAYEEYPRWHALALWTHGIVEMLASVPTWLVMELRKQCPAFIEHEARSREPKLIALHLLEWIHNQQFGYAKRQGWLGALTFYGVRHPRSECAWTYWEQFEMDCNRRRPEQYPLFDEWWHKALREEICNDISRLEVAKAVETYIGWNALLLWIRPLFRSSAMLPRHVACELERRCPGVFGSQNPGTLQGSQEKSRIWRRLTAWGRDHYLPQPKQAGWIEPFLERVRFHPRHVRLLAYGKYWAKGWSPSRRPHYPSFRQWELAADRYVTINLK
jgi:hypothetical protein